LAQSRAMASALSLTSVAAPSAGRAVLLVARRELTDQMTSLRFLTIALLAVGLTPLVVYVGVKDYGNRLAEHGRLAAEIRIQKGRGRAVSEPQREEASIRTMLTSDSLFQQGEAHEHRNDSSD